MRAVVQRVTNAFVMVDNNVVGKIDNGILAFIGVDEDDCENDIRYIAEKMIGLRIFDDKNGKLNLSINDINGSMLIISQFTLLGDARKGRRPSYIAAARPEKGKEYYEKLCELVSNNGVNVQRGIFQADMKVTLTNDGPVTILLDSKKGF